MQLWRIIIIILQHFLQELTMAHLLLLSWPDIDIGRPGNVEGRDRFGHRGGSPGPPRHRQAHPGPAGQEEEGGEK